MLLIKGGKSNHWQPEATHPGAATQEAEGVNSQATDPPMTEALEGASSLQRYQLKALIEGMLAAPRRGIAARASLHLGQPVQFVDFRDGQMRRGKIIAMRDTQATVLEAGTKRTWKIPCVAMQGYTDDERRGEQPPYEPPQEPATAATKAREFQRGDTVTFDDRDGRGITGVIVRINHAPQRSAPEPPTAERGACRFLTLYLLAIAEISTNASRGNLAT